MIPTRFIYPTAGALLALSAVVVLWPLPSPKDDRAAPPAAYRGAEHQTLSVSRARDVPFRLAGTEGPAPSSPNAPRLVGLAAGDRAYLRSASTGDVSAVRLNETVDGWTLIAIGARSVTLRAGQDTRTLALFAAAAQQDPSGAPGRTAGSAP